MGQKMSKTAIVPLVVLHAACVGVVSVTPSCGGESEHAQDGGSGGTVALAVSGFGGSVIVLAVSGFGGAMSGVTNGVTATTGAVNTTGRVDGTGGSLIVLAVSGFGGVPNTTETSGVGGDATYPGGAAGMGAAGEGGEESG